MGLCNCNKSISSKGNPHFWGGRPHQAMGTIGVIYQANIALRYLIRLDSAGFLGAGKGDTHRCNQ